METKKKDWTIEELSKKSGKIMNNPIMAAIAAYAPSPTAADLYVQSLAWPNGVAAQVRNSIRLRDKFPVAWENFRYATTRFSESFIFAKDGLPKIFGHDATLSQGIRAGNSASLHGHWPILFREIQYRSKSRIENRIFVVKIIVMNM